MNHHTGVVKIAGSLVNMVGIDNCIIFLLAALLSCNSGMTKCEEIQEWEIRNYRIVKAKCPDLVLAFHHRYTVYIGNKSMGSGASQVDSCIFTWQAGNESFLTFNICENRIQELKPRKISLDTKSIDSVTIFSNELNKTQLLTPAQTAKFVKDWNNSKTRGYSGEPSDSAFSVFPALQYKLTVFSKEDKRHFYGYNYLILDSSNWKYEMSKAGDLEYFHNYWKK